MWRFFVVFRERAGALCNLAVDHDEANRLFRRIIRGLNARRGDKPEAGLALSENRLAGFRAGIGPAHFFWQLVVNLAVWQCLLKLLDAFVGDLWAPELQVFEVRQTFQILQSSVGDLRVAERKNCEIR